MTTGNDTTVRAATEIYGACIGHRAECGCMTCVDARWTAKTIRVEVRDVYGLPKVYPVCDKARLFAQIAGTKTLAQDDLRAIHHLGYSIEAATSAATKHVMQMLRIREVA